MGSVLWSGGPGRAVFGPREGVVTKKPLPWAGALKIASRLLPEPVSAEWYQLQTTPPPPFWLLQVSLPMQLWLFSQPQPLSWFSQLS